MNWGYNPYDFNPRRRRRARMNPAKSATATIKGWTQGADLQDAALAIAGLAASSMIPPMIIKDATTTGNKLAKLGVSLVAAVGAGYLAQRFVGREAGKAAIIGGLAGSGILAIQMVTGYKIGQVAQPLSLPMGIPRFGGGEVVSPSPNRESETVGLINP